MPGTMATAATYPHAQPDPYRVLFQGLSAGAAHCRLTVERDEVVGVELLDSNRGFAPFHDALPQLIATFARVRQAGQPETLQLRRGAALLAVAVHPVGRDEAMVVIEDVSAREQLEQESRKLQGRFEQAFHGNAAAMVIARRTDLRIIDVNPRWL